MSHCTKCGQPGRWEGDVFVCGCTAPAWTPERERAAGDRVKAALPFTQYHRARAAFGGASFEFHARAETWIQSIADDLAAALAEIGRRGQRLEEQERDMACRNELRARIAELELEIERLRRACEALEAEWVAGLEARI